MATPAPVFGYKYLYYARSTVTLMYYVMGWKEADQAYVVLGSGVTSFAADTDAELNNPPDP